jgi:hypothetical protein
MNNTMYKKVSIEEELPPMDEFVTCFYEDGETMVYKRIQSSVITLTSDNPIDPTWAWTMRDGIADRTPKESKITHWLKEIGDSIPYPTDVIDLFNDDDVNIIIKDCTINTNKRVLREALFNYLKQY